MTSTTGTRKLAAPAGRPSKRARTAGATDDQAPLTIAHNIDGLEDVDDTPELPADEEAASTEAARTALLTSARRRLVPVRRAFVQLPRNGAKDADRAGPLASLVEKRQHVALDLILLLLALQPVISEKDPLPGKTWARLLTTSKATRSAATVSRTWAVLEDLQMIQRQRGTPVRPLREDGSGAPWSHPGQDRDAIGYFSLPRRYWTDGWHERLHLPGKAMLLILLAETNSPTSSTFTLPAEKIAKHYGLSLSTVKRGLRELRAQDLIGEHWQRIPAPRSTTGSTYRVHYWLKSPFSTKYRQAARNADKSEIDGRAKVEADAVFGSQT